MRAESEAAVPVRARRARRRLAWLTPAAQRSFQSADARGIDERQLTRDLARRESTYRRLLAVADLYGAALALLLAIQVLGDDTLRWETVLGLPLVIAVAKVQGLYDRDAVVINKTTLDEAPKLFQAATLYTLLLVLSQSLIIEGRLGVGQIIGLWLVMFLMAVTGRWCARQIAGRIVDTERVLVIGGPLETARVADKLAENPSVRAMVVGRIALDDSSVAEEGAIGTIHELEEIVEELGVHRAVVAPGESTYDHTLEGIRAAKAVGVQVSVLPRLLEVVGSSVEFDQVYGVSILGIRRFGLTTSSQMIKRMMDIVGAWAGLFLLAPVFAIVALLVKGSSAGPVFFRQERVGKDGTRFDVIKFRTMVEDAEQQRAELLEHNEADGLFKIANDPRVTRIGRLLRRTSLDELPQLINVWRGEMSLVGPRPLVPEEDQRIEGRHRRRLHLKPGMTGQWQIYGSSKIPLREMVTIDYLYVANWSLWGDIKILCRTVPYMLARRGL